MPRPATQLSFKRHAGWGGARAHAGRKPAGPRRRVSHLTRPPHATRHPVHLTLCAVDAVGSLRENPTFEAVWNAIAAASREAFRVAHFSIQDNHLHLIVEAHDRDALIRGIQGLAIRTARAINKALQRHGQVGGTAITRAR
jgi:hypothetical protein